MDTNKLRKTFLEYFAKYEHIIVPSSSLVPTDDPTLLFTNAGMNQFKDTFLGKEVRSYIRATSSQCCMRASGKHNDLENVGYTTRHHTFFEMLGNFSFGDYFKREAINFAWDFLTKVLKIPTEKLWVTVYKDDQEAADIWLHELKIDPMRFSRCGEKDNFWAMGDTGPCGPCSEIFYDHGAEIAGGPPGSPDEDGDRYVELWNLVFMQYNRAADGTMTSLPKPSIDTGIGLERIAAVMQGVQDNYDIDIFRNLIIAIVKIIDIQNPKDRGIRVIADHIRAVSFLIADGVVPSNEGRGYVLRRIIRRALRHGHKLGAMEIFFYKVVKPLVEEMGDAYPKLKQNQSIIEKILYLEEEQFNLTLDQGLKILEKEIAKLYGKVIPGELVFKLYDTYGFPADLTADIARELGLQIDRQGFENEMSKQRAASQKASKFNVDYNKELNIKELTEFHGYTKLSARSKIIAIIKDEHKVETLENGEEAIIILNKTPFYAEAGGQVGDKGSIANNKNCFTVTDTQKHGAVYLHYGLAKGKFQVGDQVTATVDTTRQATALNHSATHLLHTALREVLGSHVQQRGSMVNAKRLRFDFSHFEAITIQELDAIENIVNKNIRADLPVTTEEISLDEAKNRGAVALFGEKYSDIVRLVSMGEASLELCGGTHVNATGEIGLFKIITESGTAAGIRRIDAFTGAEAIKYIQEQEKQLRAAALELKTTPDNVSKKIQQLTVKAHHLEKEITRLNNQLTKSVSDELLDKCVKIQEINLIAVKLDNADINTLREAVDHLKSKLNNAVILLAGTNDEKINLVAGVSKSCSKNFPAVELVQFIAQQIDGKGGGRLEMAQGGGTDFSKLTQAIESVSKWVSEKRLKIG